MTSPFTEPGHGADPLFDLDALTGMPTDETPADGTSLAASAFRGSRTARTCALPYAPR